MSGMSSIPHEELPILEALINIRNRLTALKKDSSEFIRSHDVQQIYQQVIKQVTKLNAVRDEQQANAQAASTASSTSDHHDQRDQAIPMAPTTRLSSHKTVSTPRLTTSSRCSVSSSSPRTQS